MAPTSGRSISTRKPTTRFLSSQPTTPNLMPNTTVTSDDPILVKNSSTISSTTSPLPTSTSSSTSSSNTPSTTTTTTAPATTTTIKPTTSNSLYGLVALAIIPIIICIVAIILIFRKRRKREEPDPEPPLEAEMPEFSSRIPVDQLQGFMEDENRTIDVYSQFDRIPRASSANLVKTIRNKSKDMYADIVPYNHNCVQLQPIPGQAKSAYINASYIDSYNREKAFIAATGPRDTSVVDFWRMIWEHSIDFIFMLTLVIEKSKKKCQQYWPDVVGDSKQYGEALVTFVKEKHYLDYDVRYFSVKQNETERTVTQYQFITWNDKKAPDYPFSVLNLRTQLQRQLKITNSPILLHCSAGVGRTGSLIAIDYLLDQAQAEGAIDVYECVMKLRSQRMLMVQTPEQYNFVYEAVADGVLLGNTCIQFSQFLATYRTLKEPLEDGDNQLQQQFNLLTKMNYSITSSNLKRRRSTLPDVIRNRISSYISNRDSASAKQIDVVSVKSYNMHPTYLATSMPESMKTPSFWQTVWNNGCRSVIMLCPSSDIEVSDQYCPEEESESVVIHQFEVECKSKTKSDHHVIRKLMLTNKGSKEVTHHSVDCRMTSLKNKDIVELFTSIYEETIGRQTEHGKTLILVHCLDGTEWTGLYCAFSCLLDQINSDKEIDLFQVVRLIRTSHNRFINISQYKHLIELLYIYVQSNI